MIRLDVGCGLGGGYALTKWTFTFQDLTAAATTQAINIQENPIPGAVTITPATNFIIPQGGVILYSRIHHTVAFAGGALSSMTISIGKSGGSATFVEPAFNVFQAVADNTLQEGGLIFNAQMSSWTPNVTFTSIGANVSAATAGSVDIYLAYIDVTTSNIGTAAGVTSVALLPGASGAGVGV